MGVLRVRQPEQRLARDGQTEPEGVVLRLSLAACRARQRLHTVLRSPERRGALMVVGAGFSRPWQRTTPSHRGAGHNSGTTQRRRGSDSAMRACERAVMTHLACAD